MQTIERWKIDSNYFYSILFLETNDGTQKQVKPLEGKSIDDSTGDGRAAWLALVNNDGISNAGLVASYEALHNSNLQSGQYPDIWGCTRWIERGTDSINMGRLLRTIILRTGF